MERPSWPTCVRRQTSNANTTCASSTCSMPKLESLHARRQRMTRCSVDSPPMHVRKSVARGVNRPACSPTFAVSTAHPAHPSIQPAQPIRPILPAQPSPAHPSHPPMQPPTVPGPSFQEEFRAWRHCTMAPWYHGTIPTQPCPAPSRPSPTPPNP